MDPGSGRFAVARLTSGSRRRTRRRSYLPDVTAPHAGSLWWGRPAAASLAQWVVARRAAEATLKSPMPHQRLLGHQGPRRCSGASGKRFVALCVISITLILLCVLDETNLQPVMIAGLQSFSDGGDDVDDGDLNGKYTTLPAVFGVLHDDRVFGHYHLGGKVGLLERVNMSDSISPRGPPPTVRPSMTQASLCFLVLLPHIVYGSTRPRGIPFSQSLGAALAMGVTASVSVGTRR